MIRVDMKKFLKGATAADLRRLKDEIDSELAAREAPAAPAPTAGRRLQSYTDGASRGNPGKAGIGVLIFDENGEKIVQDCRFIGECTNNEAEYRALLLALDRALEITHDTLECYMDSELVVRQLNGQYQVKSEKMIRFWREARERAARFRKVSFHHVPREHPRQQMADKLANRGIDEANR